MNSQKFITSISTINDTKLLSRKSHTYQSTIDLKMPYKETLPLKFPKKPLRKQTQVNTLTETMQNPEKSCIRNFSSANTSRIFDEPEKQKRLANRGSFHSLSRESVTLIPLNRSLEDIGAPGNRKRFIEARHIRPDPIIIGHPNTQKNSALEKVWAEPRRHRDNGKHCEESLVWKANKNKSYLDRYRQKQEANRPKQPKESIIL